MDGVLAQIVRGIVARFLSLSLPAPAIFDEQMPIMYGQDSIGKPTVCAVDENARGFMY
jgi:hypothetical protein